MEKVSSYRELQACWPLRQFVNGVAMNASQQYFKRLLSRNLQLQKHLVIMVRERIKNLEKELKHEFYWNSLFVLGAEMGISNLFLFVVNSAQRLKLKQEQIERRKSFIRNSALGSLLVVMFVFVFYMINIIFQAAKG